MDESVTFRPTAPRLMDQVRETFRFYHYAYNTERSYVEWILKFIRFNGKKHPREMGTNKTAAITHLIFFPKPENQTDHHPPGVML